MQSVFHDDDQINKLGKKTVSIYSNKICLTNFNFIDKTHMKCPVMEEVQVKYLYLREFLMACIKIPI